MNRANFRRAGTVLLVLCGICIFIAIERYQANSSSVNAVDEIGTAIGAERDLEPAFPAGSKYALFFAALFGGGGAYCFVKARQRA